MRKNKYIIIVIILFLNAIGAIGQTKTKEELVSNFVKSVFFENKSAKFVADNYIYFEPINNSKYSMNDRIKILNKHLKKIKKEKTTFVDASNFFILPYKDYKDAKVTFTKSTQDIFILISRKNPVMYFYLVDDRILSFDYILKGDEAFFINY